MKNGILYRPVGLEMREYSNSREKILHAAEEVVMEVGAGHLTLDAVAKKAGVSKGGLMYNFPTKESLLESMIVRLVTLWKESYLRAVNDFPNTATGKLKAQIKATVTLDQRYRCVTNALLAASANEPKLMMPVKKHYRQIFAELQDAGIDFEVAAVLLMAASGLCTTEILGYSPFSGGERSGVVNQLLAMADSARA
jgi:AcrR family transcriptional regulator